MICFCFLIAIVAGIDGRLGPNFTNVLRRRRINAGGNVIVVAIGARRFDRFIRVVEKNANVIFVGRVTRCVTFEIPISDVDKIAREPGLLVVDIDAQIAWAPPQTVGRRRAEPAPSMRDVAKRLRVGETRDFDGSGVSISVLDTGFTDHAFIRNENVVARESFAPTSRTPTDLVGHGVGIISEILGSDPERLPGLACGAKVISAKIFDDDGGTTIGSIVKALDFGLARGAHVFNLSFGGRMPHPVLHEVIRHCHAAGVLIAAAAGNDGPDVGTLSYPARYPEVFSVGATDKRGNLTPWSSRGEPGRYGPDICLEGESLVLARATGTTMGEPIDDHLTSTSGTSFSAPLAACLAALLIQRNPKLRPEEIRVLLRSACVPVD
ncbi:MAG: S8 family serine peptidase [Planctomycetes bacterium]|nr:S8 family serine peptidase [Planctomycetota bacterium]